MCRLRIFFPDTDESVIVKESQHEHHHDAELRALPEELKEKIREMLKNGLTAKKIHVKFTVCEKNNSRSIGHRSIGHSPLLFGQPEGTARSADSCNIARHLGSSHAARHPAEDIQSCL